MYRCYVWKCKHTRSEIHGEMASHKVAKLCFMSFAIYTHGATSCWLFITYIYRCEFSPPSKYLVHHIFRPSYVTQETNEPNGNERDSKKCRWSRKSNLKQKKRWKQMKRAQKEQEKWNLKSGIDSADFLVSQKIYSRSKSTSWTIKKFLGQNSTKIHFFMLKYFFLMLNSNELITKTSRNLFLRSNNFCLLLFPQNFVKFCRKTLRRNCHLNVVFTGSIFCTEVTWILNGRSDTRGSFIRVLYILEDSLIVKTVSIRLEDKTHRKISDRRSASGFVTSDLVYGLT